MKIIIGLMIVAIGNAVIKAKTSGPINAESKFISFGLAAIGDAFVMCGGVIMFA